MPNVEPLLSEITHGNLEKELQKCTTRRKEYCENFGNFNLNLPDQETHHRAHNNR